jgi:nitrate/nitrite-specific signal transduction histidine kinase
MSVDRSSLSAQGEELLQAVRRSMEFTRELLRENERLRRRLAEAEDAAPRVEDAPEPGDEPSALLARLRGLEEENDRLASLYVASCQLHSTLDVDEVLRIITEIVIDLVGADVFAIYLLDERRQELRAVAAEGLDAASLPVQRPGQGRLGEAVAAGVPRTFDAPAEGGPAARDPEQPLVCIPLRLEGRVIGAIAIFGLLQQKRSFSALDQELFDVLAGHAATAIFAARLHSQSERKLSTIQGFIDLLTR